MYKFRGNIADRFGINAAVVAEYLYDGEDDLKEMELSGKTWIRCSQKNMNAQMPFLTIDQISYAVSILRDNGLIRSKKITKNSFDHTNWYTFTDYGVSLMEGGI